MLLKVLDERDYNVVILQSSSVKMSTFIKDKVKRKYRGNRDTIIDVEKSSDIKRVKEVTGIVPPFSDRWVVYVDITKVGIKEVVPMIETGTTCVFCCIVDKYKDFKSLKNGLEKNHVEGVLDYYLTYLKRPDILYLYDAFVPEDRRMTKALFDYTVQSYSSDIEAVLDLFLALGEGKEIKNRKDIADICGIGGLSIESFIFMLVKDPSTSEKGLKRVMKLRVQAGRELGEIYHFDTFYNFLSSSIMKMIDIKVLITSGVVYKSIRDLPDSYNEKALQRYQKYIWRLKEIPMTRLLRIRECMGSRRWSTEADFLNFYYNFVTRTYKDSFISKKDLRG